MTCDSCSHIHVCFEQDPWQLRQIFGDLEEGNLFLIQTSQVNQRSQWQAS